MYTLYILNFVVHEIKVKVKTLKYIFLKNVHLVATHAFVAFDLPGTHIDTPPSLSLKKCDYKVLSYFFFKVKSKIPTYAQKSYLGISGNFIELCRN